MDCHCDCCLQLELALYEEGLKKDKNVVIIQMADHEGKGWGGVLKAGTHRLVREFNDLPIPLSTNHVEAAGLFYNALGVPPDNRTYGAAHAVFKFLNIDHVKTLFMDNDDKVKAIQAAGVTYDEKIPLDTKLSDLSPEALRGLKAKHNGEVMGPDGKPVRYTGKQIGEIHVIQ